MKTKMELPAKFHTKQFAIFFLVLTTAVVIALSAIGQKNDLDETCTLAQETESFLETTCKKYENYSNGNWAKSLENLLDTAIGLHDFIDKDKLTDNHFLLRFIRAERIGGVLLTDSAGNVVSQADMDDKNASELWQETLQTKPVQDILAHPTKSYSSSTTIDGIPYNFAVIAYDGGLLLCYESTEKPSYDQYEFNFNDILANDTFRKNPTALIVKNNQMVSSNNEAFEKAVLGSDEDQGAEIDWQDDGLTMFEYEGANWFGLRSVYEDYTIYLVYPASEVFSGTGGIVSIGLIVYLALCSAILILRGYLYKKNLNTAQKQMRIIKAISATYQSTFLMHLSNLELEPINLSSKMAKTFEQHQEAHDFLTHICLDAVAPEFRDSVKELIDPSTIAQRIKGKPFIACDIRDNEGVWYSLQVIPQKYDEDGNLQAVLVATRNIVSLKQAEMLSYRDKLTGLRNRNYMEAHSKELDGSDDLPLSVIMVDCDFLKRTNDSMGHIWGDKLLQRTAEALGAAAPKDAVIMRIGGDEFLIACPKTPEYEAKSIVEKAKRELTLRSDEQLALSASFGSCTIENHALSFDQACKEADKAMYQEKQERHASRRRHTDR